MFGGYRQTFEDDPFFDFPSDRFRGTDEIFSSFFNSEPRHALTDGSSVSSSSGSTRSRRGGDRNHERGSRDLMMSDPFQSINTMMRNIQSMMGNISLDSGTKGNQNDPDAHVYSQSSFATYSNVDGGQPKIYQATSASRQMPGGLRETRKSVRDSEAGLEKMAIGRHIKERGNLITRQRNTRTGNTDESKDYFNIEEADLPQFDNEWQEKTQRYYGNMDSIGQHGQQEQPSNHKALDYGKAKHRKDPNVDPGPRESKHRHSKRK